MYDSRPKGKDGEQIEEVLPSAINATATSEKAERQRGGGELSRRESVGAGEETGMRIMHAGSPVLSLPGLSGGIVAAAAAALVLALIVLAFVLF